jgi:mono/diheme cytochrome c family protein
MRVMKFISLVVILVVASTFAVAQDKAAEAPPTVKHVPISRVSPTSGKEMFKSYCAVCHGVDAKGGGPAASALKTPPPDLTVLAQKNGGKYPAAHVAAVIRGQADIASHGSKDMPMWGQLFSSISEGHESQVQQRVANLVEYIQSLQAK